MSRYLLLNHPDTPCDAVQRIEVDLTRHGDALSARFRIAGDIDALRVPALSESRRADELWRQTCCELFIAQAGEQNYCEFNFSPSMEWAAYAFDSYRAGMKPADVQAPKIKTAATGNELALTTELNVPLSIPAAWRAAIACVIQERSGAISYWAVNHGAGKPDFHHSDAFKVELPA